MPLFGFTTDEQRRIAELEGRLESVSNLVREMVERDKFLTGLVSQINEALGGALGRINDLEAQQTRRPRSHFSKESETKKS